jgi:hypothetical protein
MWDHLDKRCRFERTVEDHFMRGEKHSMWCRYLRRAYR